MTNDSPSFGAPPPHLEPGIIPCGVPPWKQEQSAFFKAGGRYSEARGFHVLETDYLPDFDEWLPRKWAYRGVPPNPVLLPDMLPSSSWQDNLRTRLSEQAWDRLRRFCYAAAGGRCAACGSSGEPHVEAHEAWAFNEATGVQRLKGLVCLCPTCHKAKHVGYANRMGLLQQVYDRLMWLNDWTPAQLNAELARVQAKQEELSQRDWALDLSFLKTYGVR